MKPLHRLTVNQFWVVSNLEPSLLHRVQLLAHLAIRQHSVLDLLQRQILLTRKSNDPIKS